MASRKVGFGSGLAVGAILLLGIAVFANRVVSNANLGRFDLTEEKIYTVSDGAKNIIAKLDVPVQVKYYVTPRDDMPAGFKNLQQDVTDRLSELSIASNGLLEYQIVDPQESEELEDELIAKGVTPFQVQSVERDAIAVKRVYSSIGIAYKDKPEEVLPQVLPQTLNNFEYELLSRTLKLTRDADPVIAVYSTKEPVDPEMARFYMQMGQPMPEPVDAFTIVSQLLGEEGYDVRPVTLTEDDTVPEEANTLVVLAPRTLNERQRYEMYRVLARGGSVIVAVQSLLYDYTPAPRGGFSISARQQTSDANTFLEEFGVRIDDRVLMDSQMATLAIPRTQNLGGLRFQTSEPIQVPMQIRVLGEGIATDLPLTAGVPELLYLWGTEVDVDGDAVTAAGLESTAILTGGPECWRLDRSSGPITMPDLDPAGQDVFAGPTLGVMLAGTFPNPWADLGEAPAWPAAPTPPTDEGEEAPADDDAAPEILVASEAPGKLLVFGSAKLFEDMLIQQQGHALFALNCVDGLTLGDDLISIRSKSFAQRTIGDVSDGKKLAFRMLNMAAVPIAVVLFGLARMAGRRRESDAYARNLRTGGRA